MSNLSIASVRGSANDAGNHPANVLDNSPDTRFSSKGLGAYIDVELAEKASFNTVSLGFFKGNLQKTRFSVASTDDFSTFKGVHPATFLSSGESKSPEEFTFKTVTAKGVRISFEGNFPNAGAALQAASSAPATAQPPLAPSAQQNQDANQRAAALGNTTAQNVVTGEAPVSAQNTVVVGSTQASAPVNESSNTDLVGNSNWFSLTSVSLYKKDEETLRAEKQERDRLAKARGTQNVGTPNNACTKCGGKADPNGICPHCGISVNFSNPDTKPAPGDDLTQIRNPDPPQDPAQFAAGQTQNQNTTQANVTTGKSQVVDVGPVSQNVNPDNVKVGEQDDSTGVGNETRDAVLTPSPQKAQADSNDNGKKHQSKSNGHKSSTPAVEKPKDDEKETTIANNPPGFGFKKDAKVTIDKKDEKEVIEGKSDKKEGA